MTEKDLSEFLRQFVSPAISTTQDGKEVCLTVSFRFSHLFLASKTKNLCRRTTGWALFKELVNFFSRSPQNNDTNLHVTRSEFACFWSPNGNFSQFGNPLIVSDETMYRDDKSSHEWKFSGQIEITFLICICWCRCHQCSIFYRIHIWRLMNKGSKFLKKLCCCVSERV